MIDHPKVAGIIAKGKAAPEVKPAEAQIHAAPLAVSHPPEPPGVSPSQDHPTKAPVCKGSVVAAMNPVAQAASASSAPAAAESLVPPLPSVIPPGMPTMLPSVDSEGNPIAPGTVMHQRNHATGEILIHRTLAVVPVVAMAKQAP